MADDNLLKLDYNPPNSAVATTAPAPSYTPAQHIQSSTQDIISGLLPCLFIFGFIALCLRTKRVHIVIKEYENALLYKKGKYKKTLAPGAYRLPATNRIILVDMREETFSFNQHLITSDNSNFSITLSVKFQITDPYKAINSSQNYKNYLFEEVRSATKEVATHHHIAQITYSVKDLAADIEAQAQVKANSIGVKILKAEIVDMVVPQNIQSIIANTSDKDSLN